MTEALGLIEVIGYPPAIEAADAALKAANVKLGAVTRVDGGIVTVQILGDVGAVKAAVDAGSSSAARIGTVRAAHVIPRLDSSLSGFITTPGKGMRHLGRTAKSSKAESAVDTISDDEIEVKSEEHIPVVDAGIDKKPLLAVDMDEVSAEGAYIAKDIERGIDEDSHEVFDTPSKEEIKHDTKSLNQLNTRELKALITSLGIKVAANKLKTAKKEQLISMIKQFYKEGES